MCSRTVPILSFIASLNESPSQKEGKYSRTASPISCMSASMKVPPKRKGNLRREQFKPTINNCLNESPSQKEGKCQTLANALDPFTLPQ